MDLNLLPLLRREGQDLSNLPGLHVAAPPRRPARGRQVDRLIIYFILEGISPLSTEQQSQLLTDLAKTYYQTPGSVTAAMRTVAERLNDILLERNLRASNSGQQGSGQLALVALRGDQIILAQCGPMQAFLIQAAGAQRLFEPDSSHRGLGQGRSISILYSQANLSANDTLLLTHQPSPAWSKATLSGAYGQGPEGIRRRLFGQANSDFQAILLQARSGPGRVHLLLPQASSGMDESGQPSTEEPPITSTAQLEPSSSIEPAPGMAPEPTETSAEVEVPTPPSFTAAFSTQTSPNMIPQSANRPEPAAQPKPISYEPAPAAPSHPQVSGPTEPAARPVRQPRGQAFAPAGRALAGTFGGLAKVGQALGRRMLPGEGTLPSSVMAFLAVAVPLVVVTIATIVYFERGRAAQYQTYYSQAVQAAQEAQAQSDPQALRTAWGTVIAYLDRADDYGITPSSRDLRSQAQQVFDELEGIRRINFEPAISGGLPRSFEITQIVATENELYLLDSASGSVARAVQTGQVYEMDNSFQCGPGLPVGQATGQIIDIAPMPKGNEANAKILAMDGQGNLLQCIPGEQPVFNVLAPPPTNWGNPKAFSFDLGNLYVLDPQTNAVWVYWGGDFSSQPQFFFSEGVPPMEDVMDLAVDKNDLYLLHVDGHITLCTFSNLGVSPTRCTDPFPYADSRAGREGQILIPEAPFVQIRNTQPPDPSLYLLQANTQAIFHFSLRLLTFQRQLRSQNPLPADSPATAFAIRPDGRVVFMGLGNRVYYAGMP